MLMRLLASIDGDRMGEKRISLALVGCGAISEWHRNALDACGRFEIVACVDPDIPRAKACAEAHQAAVYPDLQQCLDQADIEAVDLMLPHQLHEETAILCLRAGKHVLLEKPMAPTLAACEKIIEASHESTHVFMLGENAQYWPEIRIVSDLIQQGAIGELITARAQLFFPPMKAYYQGETAWRLSRDATGGGISIDTGSHYIRPLRMWFGEMESLVAVMERPFSEMEGESMAKALLRFRSGQVASLELLLNDAVFAPQEIFRITGSRGEISVTNKVKLFNADNPAGIVVQKDRPQGYMHSYAAQFDDFASAIRDGTSLQASAEYAVGELRVALAMERSAKTKRWESVW